ncbi:hypothetical protein [Bythopirellula polymerisocia]|uniref:Uncharacterized protein n=1 Tax=Bythopirellula polymerisocia TaxID=2528003 RepID=A0A5C6CT88_9BACT|nr:hypothetical protein [Bythopirellula polymerisocia]TWU25959.1 hypothetical protein Pla144_31730 [Bythopirellula polymerisocia]
MCKMFFGIASVMLLMTASSAQAFDGSIDRATLSAMGLHDATIVSDQVAESVRGHGYQPHSIAIAAGGSFAYVGKNNAAAGSANGYFAAGHHFAGGINGSAAGKTTSKTVSFKVFGVPVKSITTTKSVHVYAGGFSAASAF